MKEQRGLQVSKDTKFREGPTGQALSRFAEKKKLKNTGSHQQVYIHYTIVVVIVFIKEHQQVRRLFAPTGKEIVRASR